MVRVTEWQRRNGAIIGHAQTTSTKLPHQVLLCHENEILGITLFYWVTYSYLLVSVIACSCSKTKTKNISFGSSRVTNEPVMKEVLRI